MAMHGARLAVCVLRCVVHSTPAPSRTAMSTDGAQAGSRAAALAVRASSSSTSMAMEPRQRLSTPTTRHAASRLPLPPPDSSLPPRLPASLPAACLQAAFSSRAPPRCALDLRSRPRRLSPTEGVVAASRTVAAASLCVSSSRARTPSRLAPREPCPIGQAHASLPLPHCRCRFLPMRASSQPSRAWRRWSGGLLWR